MKNKKRLTIYDIKRASEERGSLFFSKANLKHSGQVMKDFKVYKVSEELYFITAPIRTRDLVIGRTEIYYHVLTGRLSKAQLLTSNG